MIRSKPCKYATYRPLADRLVLEVYQTVAVLMLPEVGQLGGVLPSIFRHFIIDLKNEVMMEERRSRP